MPWRPPLSLAGASAGGSRRLRTGRRPAPTTLPPALLDRGHRRPWRRRSTSIVSAAVSSPWPSSRTPSSARRDQAGRRSAPRRRSVWPAIDPAGIDRGLQAAEIDLGAVDLANRVLEAALGQTPVDRHLAALEGAAASSCCVRALAPLWPLPEVLPRPEPMPRPSRLRLRLPRARIVAQFVELHRRLLVRSRPARPGPGAGPCRSGRASPGYRPRRGCDAACSARGRSASARWSPVAGDRALDLGDPDASAIIGPHSAFAPRVAGRRGARRCRRPSCRAWRRPARATPSWTSASKVALTMLCGLVEPSDLATTSWMPSASNTARIGPPAMMPVPGGAARSSTCPAPKWPIDVVMQRAALAQRHADHAALGLLGRLAHRLRHLARLAAAVADPALAVADDHQRREAEPPAALDHLGDAVDADQAVDQLAVA